MGRFLEWSKSEDLPRVYKFICFRDIKRRILVLVNTSFLGVD